MRITNVASDLTAVDKIKMPDTHIKVNYILIQVCCLYNSTDRSLLLHLKAHLMLHCGCTWQEQACIKKLDKSIRKDVQNMDKCSPAN